MDFRAFGYKDIEKIPQLQGIPAALRTEIRVAASVLPFRVNNHVLDELIDWDRVPDDPMFQLVFPQRDMLEPEDFAQMLALHERDAPTEDIKAAARTIQMRNNPHPAGQLQLNVPRLGDRRLQGLQHKYDETVLFFPAQGQTCHSYCTYCFRWPQFVGLDELKFAAQETDSLMAYVAAHPTVTDVLVTGGDPMVMRAKLLRRYLEPLLERRPENLRNLRIGTKAPAFWPYRFTQGEDADDTLRLLESIVASGLHVAIMVHFSHPREVRNPETRRALARILATGATVRCQAPLIRHVNDDARLWAEMWRQQVKAGAIPYYMFVERDTGPRGYFEVPLSRAHEIYRDAISQVSGLARTARGPSMSHTHGKIVVDGVMRMGRQKFFALRYLQARSPELVGRPFLANFDETATWFDQLTPAEGQDPVFWRGARLHPARLAATA